MSGWHQISLQSVYDSINEGAVTLEWICFFRDDPTSSMLGTFRRLCRIIRSCWDGVGCLVYWWCWYVDGLIISTLQLLAETLLWEASVAVYCIWSPSCPYVNAQLISSYCFCALLCAQVTVQWRLYFSMLLNNVFKKTSHGQTSGTAAFPWTSITWKRCGGKVAPGNCQLKPSQGSSKMAQWVKAQQAEFLGPTRKRERSDSWRMCPSVLSLSLPTSPLWYTHRNKCNVCVYEICLKFTLQVICVKCYLTWAWFWSLSQLYLILPLRIWRIGFALWAASW